MKDQEKIFISYSWENEQYSLEVIAFANYLRTKGYNVELDKFLMQQESAISFSEMMHKGITDYTKVIIILSEGYKKKADSFQDGVGAEYRLILNDFIRNPNKYILTTFTGRDDSKVPLFFQNREILDISDYSDQKLEKLYRKLSDIPEFEFSEVGSSKPELTTKKLTAMFFSEDEKDISLLNKNAIPGLSSFISKLANPQANIFRILNFPIESFEDLSSGISQNPNDAASGVNRVLGKAVPKLFSSFDNLLIKFYSEGNRQYFFYTVTSDITKVVSVFEALVNLLGAGIYDNRQFQTFRNIDSIKNIALGFASLPDDDCQTWWKINDRFDINLLYKTTPKQQLVMIVNEKKVFEIPNMRRNDSIYPYLKFDIETILARSKTKHTEYLEDDIKFVDYITTLDEPVFDIFDKVTIRLFRAEKFFDINIQTHLFFHKKRNNFNIADIEKIVNKLHSIYGYDNTNYGLLKDYERKDAIKERNWPSGRNYWLDTDHKLYKSGEENSLMYQVETRFNEHDQGLELSILCYNDLLKHHLSEN